MPIYAWRVFSSVHRYSSCNSVLSQNWPCDIAASEASSASFNALAAFLIKGCALRCAYWSCVGLTLSLMMEQCIKKLENEIALLRAEKSSHAASTVNLHDLADDDDENHEDDEKLERCCLQMAIEETSVEPSNRWRPWAFQLALFALVKSS